MLAAGGSRRLGRPKQLLPNGQGTLLDHVLDVARACAFDQCLCVLGGEADGVRRRVDLRGVELLVLMLGDQPGVRVSSVAALLAGRGQAPMAACAYEDGRGHPLAFTRSTFGELAALHGDKGVWRLMDHLGDAVAEVAVAGRIPRAVDTWEDYEAVIAGVP